VPAMNQSSGATEARLYLATLFGAEHADSLIEVRCPKVPAFRRFSPVGEIEDVATHVERCAKTTDVYVGVAPRIRIEGKQTGGKSAIDHVQVLWADCDTADSIAMLVDFAPDPTIEVSSGGGVHAYWMLTAPVSKEQAEIGNSRLALALGADSAATDSARVLRPPGTFNHKPERLVDGKPALVTLRALTEARYTWEETVGVLPDPPTRRSTPSTARARVKTRATTTAGSAGRVADDPLFRFSPPEYVELLSKRKIDRRGYAFCPFHDDQKTPNLRVWSTVDKGWFCFVCKKGGGIIEFGALLFGIKPRGADYHRLRREIAARLLGRAA
jgi:hypothetical protein